MIADISYPASREDWLQLRSNYTGASEVAALVGAHPYMTVAELWARKAGRLPQQSDNPSMRRGRYLEDVALRMLMDERPDWKIAPNGVPPGSFYTDRARKLCATPDAFAAAAEQDTLGIIQVKSIEPQSFRRSWINEDGEIEAPVFVSIQTMVEMHLTGCAWGVIVALVVGQGIDIHILPVQPIEGMIERLTEANLEFWAMVESGVRPPLDYGRDLNLVTTLNKAHSDKTVDLSHDNEFAVAIRDHVACSEEIGHLTKRKARAETLIRDKLGDASFAEAGDFFVSAKLIHRAAHEVAATNFRQLRIKYRGGNNA